MTAPESEETLDRLLTRGRRLSGAQREAVFNEVLAKTRARPPFWRSRAMLVGAGVLSAAAAVVLARSASIGGDAFRAKGASTPTGPHITLSCKDGGLTGCPRASKLLFVAGGGEGSALFLNAYADNAATGERIWFAPSESGAPAAVAVAVNDQLLDRAIPLANVPPGQYRVHLSLSPAPLSRAEVLLRNPANGAENGLFLTVVP